MSNKRGFTIVELAIVLVVIGIILGMAVKGKQLVDAARDRAELAKITKLEAATAIYYSYVNGSIIDMTVFPPGLVGGMTHVNIDHMQSLGIITLGELKSRYRRNFPGRESEEAYWMGFLCDREVINNEKYWKISGPINNNLNICAMLAVEENMGVRFGISFYSKKIMCLTETFMDDEDLHSGNAMSIYYDQLATISSAEYKDCQALPDTTDTRFLYAYKLL